MNYRLHGLRIRSAIPLPAPLDRGGRADLGISWSDEPCDFTQPSAGTVIARMTLGNGFGHTHTETGKGYTLRFHHLCEVRLDSHRRSARVSSAEGVDTDFVSLLLAGNVVAFVLTLAGQPVLHASAVLVYGAGLAFAGAPGMGKSTLAALFCAQGFGLITDDVLRLERDTWRCFPGTSEIRLRDGAATLATEVPHSTSCRSADHRLVVRLENTCRSLVPLRAIVIPRPSRDAPSLTVTRLPAREALLALLRYPRVSGLEARDLVAQQFRALGALVPRIPVYQADIPWGPPFAPGITDELLEAVGWARRPTEVVP